MAEKLNWQPIETAPTDGTIVLVLHFKFGHPDVDVAQWRDACVLDDGEHAAGWWNALVPDWDEDEWGDIAYWMPLPSLPEWPAK